MDERDQSTGEAEGELSPHGGNARGGDAHGGAPSHAAMSAQLSEPDAADPAQAEDDRDGDHSDEAIAGHIGPSDELAVSEDEVAPGLVPDDAKSTAPATRAGATAPSGETEAEEEEALEPVAEEPQEQAPVKLDWYILKVQSNREDSIADALHRRIKIAGLDRYFDEVIVPIEKVSEFKNGKKRVVKRKLYPGYIVVHMELNDDTWFLVRETPGIGDFTGSGGKPTPMLPHEVNKIVAKQEDKTEEQAVIDVKFKPGDRVRINEGTFENFEGDVDNIDMANGRVTVMINIFGRSTPVELEYWQVEGV